MALLAHARQSLLLLLVASAGAQVQPATQHDRWLRVPGLPENIIRGLTQTSDGYLWIATMDGLARYDGVRMTIFNRGNSPGFAANRLESLFAAPSGELWMNTESGRVIHYSNGVFHTLHAPEDVPDGRVNGLSWDKRGHVWVLVDGMIYAWNPNNARFMQSVPQEGLRFKPLIWEHTGFYATRHDSIVIFKHGMFQTLPLPRGIGGEQIWGAALDSNGTCWVETSEGRRIRITPDGSSYSAGDKAHPYEIAYRDDKDREWVITVNSRLVRNFAMSDGNQPSLPVLEIFQDREGGLWLATNGFGLLHLRHQIVITLSKPEGLAGTVVYPITQEANGTIWIGAWPGGLSGYDNGKFKTYGLREGLPNLLVTGLFVDHEGNLWVATHGGLVEKSGSHFVKPRDPALAITSTIQAITQTRDGTLWFGTSDGLISYKNGERHSYTKREGLQTDDVRVLLQAHNGDLWVGGYGGLTRMRPGAMERWSGDSGLPSDNIRSLYEDSDGTLWVGSYDGGLGRYRGGRWSVIGSKAGLPSDGVFQILNDYNGNFWFSSNRGIYRVSRTNLDAFADGKLPHITAVSYGEADGMRNAECNGGLSPAGLHALDGRLWFPTQDGVAIIDPKAVGSRSTTAAALLESANVAGQDFPAAMPLQIPPHKTDIEIHYTAPVFTHPEQVRFRYRLEGFDSNWTDAGSRRTAYFSRLPAGKYLFHVVAGYGDGYWQEDGAYLPLEVQAPFYQTWWFAFAMFFCALAIITYASALRVRRAEAAREAQRAFSLQLISSQESERKRIAAELHDSIGQRLVVMKNLASFFLQAAARPQPPPIENIEAITEQATLAIEDTRTISYNLRPFHLDRLGLKKALEALVRATAEASGITAECELDDVSHALTNEQQINLYRIAQEALNNVVKHSGASVVSIFFRHSVREIVLTIHDNGKGLPSIPRAGDSGTSGFGLTGMRERANLVNGTLFMQSNGKDGTTVRVHIPLAGN